VASLLMDLLGSEVEAVNISETSVYIFTSRHVVILQRLVKLTLEQVMKAQMGIRCSSILSLISPLVCVGRLKPRPGRFTRGQETRYPLNEYLNHHENSSTEANSRSSIKILLPL